MDSTLSTLSLNYLATVTCLVEVNFALYIQISLFSPLWNILYTVCSIRRTKRHDKETGSTFQIQ